jgi:hypothetical protein
VVALDRETAEPFSDPGGSHLGERPVQQLNAPDGPLDDVAKGIGERLVRFAQKLDAR